jgi:hypothetical protein
MSLGSVPDSAVSYSHLPRPRVSPRGERRGRPRGGAQDSQLLQFSDVARQRAGQRRVVQNPAASVGQPPGGTARKAARGRTILLAALACRPRSAACRTAPCRTDTCRVRASAPGGNGEEGRAGGAQSLQLLHVADVARQRAGQRRVEQLPAASAGQPPGGTARKAARGRTILLAAAGFRCRAAACRTAPCCTDSCRVRASAPGGNGEEGRAGAHKYSSCVSFPMSLGSVPDSAVLDRYLPRPRVSPRGERRGRPRRAHKVSSCSRLATAGCSS